MSEHNWIRASEIGDYIYCRRSWWLKRVAGKKSRNVVEMRRGTEFHLRHTDKVEQAKWTRKLGYVLLALAVAFLLFSVINM